MYKLTIYQKKSLYHDEEVSYLFADSDEMFEMLEILLKQKTSKVTSYSIHIVEEGEEENEED